MKKVTAIFFFVASGPLHGCPTCIGLPRSRQDRPFSERKSFIAALQRPNAQKQQGTPKKEAPDKQSHEKN